MMLDIINLLTRTVILHRFLADLIYKKAIC